MKKILVVFGTRPETIKMAPIVRELSSSLALQPVTCAVAQHRGMLDQVVEYFGLKVDIDLDLMKPNQTLNDVVSRCTSAMHGVLTSVVPAMVLVQGDTTTTMAAALAAFNCRTKVGHVEAGLRTKEKSSPFPEEMNRRLVTPIADLHFAPTPQALGNLISEGISDSSAFLTGNTGVDSFLWAASRDELYPHLSSLYGKKRLVLLTAHRRESFGEPMERIFTAIREFLFDHEDLHLVYPVHPNPAVKGTAERILGDMRRVSLIPPVSYGELIYLMKESRFVLTDSGGVQEEAPSIGKPVLVLRETTERMEAVEAGSARLVGSDKQKIMASMAELADERSALYQAMSRVRFPFGDGTAAKQIVSLLERYFDQGESQ